MKDMNEVVGGNELNEGVGVEKLKWHNNTHIYIQGKESIF